MVKIYFVKPFFTFLTLLLFAFSNAQNLHNGNNYSKQTFISYKSYKELKKVGEMKLDSLGIKINNKDTLIIVSGFVMPKGFSVPYEPKDSLFLETYKELVYNKSGFSKQNRIKNPSTMKIWKEEIKVYFDSTVTNKNKRELIKFMKSIDKEIDSLNIKIVASKEKSNYFIYFLNKPNDIDWDLRIRNNDGCYILWNGKQQLYKCTMKINAQIIYNELEQLILMKKHFIWSLGYFTYLTNKDCKSYLSNCVSLEKELTKEDLELLKYHYSYGICKGTDLETFENNHKDAKESLKQNNKFTFFHRTD